MGKAEQVIGLAHLGIVRARGADAARFLQGQLSNDVSRLAAGRLMMAGYHNPQGRTVALLRLILREADDILAILPRELVAPVLTRLARFVLRSKVKLTDESQAFHLAGIIGSPSPGTHAAAATALPGALAVPVGRARSLLILPGEVSLPPTAEAAQWEQLEIADGLPEVQAATSEEFVAQMLNLDAVDAIAFDKGCYTGQEVIARAHYRGRVKRRMQRFVTRGPAQLQPGDSGQLPDGRTFKVVRAVGIDGGRCEFLAVAPIAGAGESADAPAGPVLDAEAAPLPYSLPE